MGSGACGVLLVLRSSYRLGGKEDSECRSAHRVSLRPDASTMLQDDRAADSEPQSATALLPRVRGIDLLESSEDRLKLVRWDTATLINDRQSHSARARTQHY